MKAAHLGIAGSVFILSFLTIPGCKGPVGPAGPDGQTGLSCTASDDGAGTVTLTCEDGTTATVTDGTAGGSCTVVDNGDGTKTISCDDGTTVTVTDGQGGTPGTTGSSGRDPTGLNVTITGVTLVAAGAEIHPEVTFTVLDEADEPFSGVPAGAVRFTFAQLIPGSNGDASAWQSYISKLESPGTVGTGDGSDESQATYERTTAGAFVNSGDGTYVYTFGLDAASVTTPVAVTYDDTYTHRVGLQISGSGMPVANATYTWVPATGDTTGIPTRTIVKTDTCNSCHNKLALHGGGRVEVDYCVTCHNPGSIDANSDQSVDFKVMIHKIHMGRNLPSVELGGEFAIWGYRDSKHDYSDVGFPQSIPTCTKCHDPDDMDTPDAADYSMVPTMQACGSCHDHVDFAAGTKDEGEPSAGPCTTNADCTASGAGATCDPGTGHCLALHPMQADNSACTTCHPPTGTWTPGTTPAPVITVHQDVALLAAAAFQYNIESITYAAPDVTIVFSVTNPATGAHYDILGDPEFTAGGGASRLGIIVGWDTSDYSNEGSGRAAGAPVTVNALTNAVLSTGACPADCTFEVSATLAGAALASGSGVVAIEGHPAGDDGTGAYTVRVPVRSAVEYFAITDATAQPRREVVSITAKCDNCHGTLSMHGANRTDEGQVCVICHNPNATDINRRPDDHTVTATADGAKEASIDFKRMIHAIHGAAKRENPYVVWGFGNNEHVFGPDEVQFPGILNDCTTCHLSATFELPLAEGVLATTIDTADGRATKGAATAGELEDPSDDLNISPTAAVCSACHDTLLAQAHMEQNGGAFSIAQADVGAFAATTETCAVCHGPGRDADLARVHGLAQ